MSPSSTETIARTGRGTAVDGDHDGGAARWDDVERMLRAGGATCWLSVRGRDDGVHTRPVFAAWTGSVFVLASKAGAVKTRLLEAAGRVSLALDLGELHLVVDATASRLVDEAGLRAAAQAMREVYDWPAEVVGDELDAPYGAPTSGGPPFQAWELAPRRAWAFPTADQVEPTRFVFEPVEGAAG